VTNSARRQRDDNRDLPCRQQTVTFGGGVAATPTVTIADVKMTSIRPDLIANDD